jgi:hypothetical protein
MVIMDIGPSLLHCPQNFKHGGHINWQQWSPLLPHGCEIATRAVVRGIVTYLSFQTLRLPWGKSGLHCCHINWQQWSPLLPHGSLRVWKDKYVTIPLTTARVAISVPCFDMGGWELVQVRIQGVK